jgi:O-antigen ligase
MVFFYAPFALVFCLLRELTWTPRLLRVCLILVAALAVLFAFIGFAEYATKTIILNPKLVVQNDLHTYFTVNSVFFDPDIFGRFLALVMVVLAAVLLSLRRAREALIVSVVLALLWAGLVLTLSRSSLGALLLGLLTLAALRWRARLTVAIAAAVVLVGVIAILASPKTFGLNQGLNGASSGRAGLVSGGVHMLSERPLWGFGSGSFVARYREEHPTTAQTLAASHTIAVTIAAEQGLIGEIVYIALVLVALATLLRHARGDPARMAIAAAFLALVLHTNLYADFLEDPVTWTLLAIGAALAAQRRPERREHRARKRHRPDSATARPRAGSARSAV